MHFRTTRVASESAVCVSGIDVRLDPLGDGGIAIAWIAQERRGVDGECIPIGVAFSGAAAVDGPCCAKTFDVTLPNEGLTFRMTVQSDWQAN